MNIRDLDDAIKFVNEVRNTGLEVIGNTALKVWIMILGIGVATIVLAVRFRQNMLFTRALKRLPDNGKSMKLTDLQRALGNMDPGLDEVQTLASGVFGVIVMIIVILIK